MTHIRASMFRTCAALTSTWMTLQRVIKKGNLRGHWVQDSVMCNFFVAFYSKDPDKPSRWINVRCLGLMSGLQRSTMLCFDLHVNDIADSDKERFTRLLGARKCAVLCSLRYKGPDTPNQHACWVRAGDLARKTTLIGCSAQLTSAWKE